MRVWHEKAIFAMFLVAAAVIALSVPTYAITEDGRIVLLLDNGQWQFLEEERISETVAYRLLAQALKMVQNIVQKYASRTIYLIPPGSNQTFILKGGNDIVIVDSLVFKLKSDIYGAVIVNQKLMILDTLMGIFMNKAKSELTTVEGLENLKQEIKEAVEKLVGCSGSDEIQEVYLYIKAIVSTE